MSGTFLDYGFNRILLTLSGTIQIADSTTTTVPWNVELQDTLNAYNDVVHNGNLPIPTGFNLVKFTGQIDFTSSALGIRQVIITKVNTEISPSCLAQKTADANDIILPFNSYWVITQPGDFFRIRVFQNSGGNLTLVNNQTWISAEYAKF